MSTQPRTHGPEQQPEATPVARFAEWGVRYLDGRGDPVLIHDDRELAESQLTGARYFGYKDAVLVGRVTGGDWTPVQDGGAR